jgi:multicomponent Na+:H+ antiporter subunit E
MVFALVWLGLNGWDMRSWLVGIPFLILATWISLKLVPCGKNRLTLVGILPFSWFFLRKSVYGGIDVALRTLRPVVDVNPGVVEYEALLVRGRALVFVSGIISLLPGTLSVSLEGNYLRVHVLDLSAPIETELRELEGLVAGLFVSNLDLMKDTE